MNESKSKKRPGLLHGALSFLNLVLIVLAVRWLVFEIFLIPSGSMYPKLFINDYIIVSKVDFGLRIPFSQNWFFGPYAPKRTAVVVFKDPDDSKYLIKRMVGLPSDMIEVVGDFIASVNGERVTHNEITGSQKLVLAETMKRDVESFSAFKEIFPGKDPEHAHIILTEPESLPPQKMSLEDYSENLEVFEVPEGEVLFMGDNRNNSFDGRSFGFVSLTRLVGRARFIGLSCDDNIVMGSGCDLRSIRPDRIGSSIAY